MDGDEELGVEDEAAPELDTEVEDESTETEVEDEGESEGEAEGGEEKPAAGEGEQVSRRTLRVQKLAEERDAERAETARLRTELDNLKRAETARMQVDPAAARAEAERLAAMEPTERALYESNKRIEALQNQVANLGHITQDASDKASFEAKAVIDPLHAKYKDRVETTLQGMRAKGVNANREAILTYLIGEEAQKRATQKPMKQGRKDAAASRVERAQGKAPSTRSDAGGSRSEKSLEDRLRGVQI